MDSRLELAIERVGRVLNEVDYGCGHFITSDSLKIMDVQMLYDAHSVMAGKVAELTDLLRDARRTMYDEHQLSKRIDAALAPHPKGIE